MSEKFSDYADVKQLLLERLVGNLQRAVDHRAHVLKRTRFGTGISGPWAEHKDKHSPGADGVQVGINASVHADVGPRVGGSFDGPRVACHDTY